MTRKIAQANYVSTIDELPLHQRLRSRAIAGITAGCLALTLCPAAAFAAMPPSDMGSQQNGAPTMQQQMSDQGQQFGQQAPADNQAFANNQTTNNNQMPSAGQAPGNDQQAPNTDQQAPNDNQQQGALQPGNPSMNNDFDNQVRQYLQDTFSVNAFLQANGIEGVRELGQQLGNPSEAPEIPEGQINVQAVIDSVHDIIRTYGAEALESVDFSDPDFQAKLAEYVKTATQERLAMFKSGMPQDGAAMGSMEQPSDLPAPDGASPDGAAPDSAAPNGTTENTVANAIQNQAKAPVDAPNSSQTISSSLLGNLVNFIVELF